MKNKTSLSLESAKNLYKSTGLMIETMTQRIDIWMNQKKAISQILASLNIGQNQDWDEINSLLDFAIHISFQYIELGATLRLYLSAGINYEERYAVKQLNVIMIEGYKRIYGYGKNISDSFWVSKIAPICENLPPEYKAEYDELTQQLIAIGNSDVFDKDSRDYAVHYDVGVEKVYEMLCSLDAETATQKVIQFLSLLQKLIEYASKILGYKSQVLKSNNNTFMVNLDAIGKVLKTPYVDDCSKQISDELISRTIKLRDLFK